MILTLNAGSSSLKFALFRPGETFAEVIGGLVERIGEAEGRAHLTDDAGDTSVQSFTGAHADAFAWVATQLRDRGLLPGVTAVGHRVVHGGERFRAPTLVTPEVESAIADLASLAPLHNPHNLTGIALARATFPDVAHVAVFDTAFHATLPPAAYRYAVPEEWYTEFGVRRYGFHGTSHAFVSGTARDYLAEAGRPHRRLVTLHLGNGCSAAAVLDGECVDTSMGLTPLAGLIMGTRSGDVDPGLPAFLAAKGLDVYAQNAALNKASGLLALSGENDMRALLERRANGHDGARLAVAAFTYAVRKTVGAYAAALGGLDALVFTAGIGENAAAVRAEVCEGLEFLGIAIDGAANDLRGDGVRTIGGGSAAVLVVPTAEELAIARATARVASGA